MKTVYIYKIMRSFLLVILLLVGCTERKLEYRPSANDDILIQIEWVNISTPSEAVFYFFPIDGGAPVKVTTPASGFTGTLPVGQYNVLVMSAQTKGIDLSNFGSYEAARIYALQNGAQLVQPIIFGMGTHIEGKNLLTIPYLGSVREKVKVYPQHTFHITFELEGDATEITSLLGTLNGTTPWRNVATGETSPDRIPTPYTTATGSEYNTLTALITVLGYTLSPGTGDLYMDVLLHGKHYTITLDLTKELQEIIDKNGGRLPLDVYLTIVIRYDGIKATATVTEWISGGSASGIII